MVRSIESCLLDVLMQSGSKEVAVLHTGAKKDLVRLIDNDSSIDLAS